MNEGEIFLSSLEFKEIRQDDAEVISKYLSFEKSGCSDYTLGFVMMWKKPLNLCYAVSNDMMIIKGSFRKGVERFYMPCGGGDFKAATLDLLEYCKENDIEPTFTSISPANFERFNEILEFDYTESRDYSDYVYRAEDLANLSGRKYHQKRNHISKFKKKYTYSYNRIDEQNIEKVVSFFKEFSNSVETESFSEEIERERCWYLLENMKKFYLFGAFLEVDGKAIAFTLGEIKDNCLYVHVEKADRNFDGSYATINNEFSKDCFKNYGVEWINREDDSGDEGLRKAKMSYNPDHLALKGKLSNIRTKL